MCGRECGLRCTSLPVRLVKEKSIDCCLVNEGFEHLPFSDHILFVLHFDVDRCRCWHARVCLGSDSMDHHTSSIPKNFNTYGKSAYTHRMVMTGMHTSCVEAYSRSSQKRRSLKFSKRISQTKTAFRPDEESSNANSNCAED